LMLHPVICRLNYIAKKRLFSSKLIELSIF